LALARDGPFFFLRALRENCAIVGCRPALQQRYRCPTPTNLFSVFPETSGGEAFRQCQDGQACRGQGAFCRRRSRRRLLPGGAGSAQGQYDFTVRRRADFFAIVGPGGIVGELSTIDGPAALGGRWPRVRDFGADLRQPCGLPGLRRGRTLRFYKDLVALLASRLRDNRRRGWRPEAFLPLKRPGRPGAARSRRSLRPRRGPGAAS